jgi:protein TonB
LLLRRSVPIPTPSPVQGTIALLMVENKGAKPREPTATPAPSQPSPAEPKAAAAAKLVAKDVAPAQQASVAAAPTRSEHPQPTENRKQAENTPQTEHPPQTERPKQAPATSKDSITFDLSGTDSDTNARTLGSQIVPASPDDRFRNRPPPYPDEAILRDEHGSVVVMIHVSDVGLPTGVDILESSGYPLLDQAAVAAVRKWHFRPALRDDHAVAFDMEFRFDFEPKGD